MPQISVESKQTNRDQSVNKNKEQSEGYQKGEGRRMDKYGEGE